MADELLDLSRCAPHTITFKPLSLAECCAKLAAAGCGGVCVWRDALAAAGGAGEAARIVKGSGLRVPSLVRGGFFLDDDATDVNKQCLDAAAAVGAEMVVLVVGATPGVPLAEARKRVADGMARVVPHAQAVGVRLAVEPLHPMYADARSCVNRVKEATDLAETLGSPAVGVAVDVYHVWWDPDLDAELERCARLGRLFGFHACDWRVPTRDLLVDRAPVGEGCIDVRGIRRKVEALGFRGMHEVEVFSQEGWALPQEQWMTRVLDGYRRAG